MLELETFDTMFQLEQFGYYVPGRETWLTYIPSTQ